MASVPTHRLGALAAAVLLVITLLPVTAAPLRAAAPSELFFSEYIEGSSNNKALEIFNGTGSTVDLSAGGYNVQVSFNGSTSAGLTINLTGTVANGDVYVLAQSSASATILAQADQTNGAGWFNGDDAVVLRKGTSVVDAIGQVGFDPGSEWGSGLTSTADNTLRRQAGVCAGDPDGSNVFDPSVEWTGYATDTFDGLGAHTAACGPASPVINEFSASTAGTDAEYVEIHGEPGTDLSAYTVLEIEGDTTGAGTVDEIIPLGTTDADGLYLASLPANALENGTLTLLLVDTFTGTLGSDLDTDNDGTFDVTPWTSILDSVAVTDGGAGDVTYGTPALGPNYDGVSGFAPGGASRIPDGIDTDTASDWVRNDFDLAGISGFPGTITLGEAYNTPGAPNEAYVLPPEACGDPFTPIHDIQGDGAASPLAGTGVAAEGIVVGDFQNNASADSGDLNGFHVQAPDAEADADPATSEGIFVYAPGSIDVAPGDAVRVRGSVSEFNGMTELSASQLWVCSTGNPLPGATALSLPVATADAFESVEGMRVVFPQDLVIAEYFNFDRFGEIVLSSERRYQPTAAAEPGAAAIAIAAENVLDRITIDDGRSSQNPDPAIHPNGSEFTLDNRFRGGDTVTDVTGVMDYAFGLYRVQPTAGATYTATNPRPSAPGAVGGTIRAASLNTLNDFLTLDGGSAAWICGPSQDQECRGADDATEFGRQRAKLLAAIRGLDADVIGLNEIENTTGVDPLADLAAGLNDVLGAGTYASIDTGTIGTDAIRVGLLYRPAAVTPVGGYAILDTSVDPRFLDTKNRPVLAQTFEENATGARFTVAVSHLKSKGSDCNDVGDPDLGDGAGNCNLTRTAAAQALVDWLATDPTGSGSPNALVIGDLNAYTFEDPVDAIVAGPDDTLGTSDDYTNLVAAFVGADAYSYVFDGQLGYLDHALASASLAGKVTGVTEWHINADEPDILDYDTSFKQPAQDLLYAPDAYRSSDHDPVIVGLDFRVGTTTTLVIDPATQQYSDAVTLTATISPSAATGTVQFRVSSGGAPWSDIGSPVAVSGGSASLSGVQILDGAGTDVRFKAVFAGTGVYTGSSDVRQLTVAHERAAVRYAGSNPVAHEVDAPGSGSWAGPLTLSIDVSERTPDSAGTGTALPGDIGLGGLAVQLVPLGPGAPISLSCSAGTVSGSGYDAVKSFSCASPGAIPLGSYDVVVTVTGSHYAATYGDAFTVHDPSLGFATGGGSFLFDGDQVTFGFTTKYNRKGTAVQGNFIAIRHYADGTVSRLKSNALSGMAILEAGGCGIATFAGKATYTTWDPTLEEDVTTGNAAFSVRADDCGSPGTGVDRIWVGGVGDLAMPSPAPANLEELTGGNISVPHASSQP